MKELTLDDVLVIAGGLPPGAALDEASYHAPAEALRDPMAFGCLEGHEPPQGDAD